MASVDVVPGGSGNTSQESRGSGSHKSMLELLSITDAAVKALNKSMSTASNASGKSQKSEVSVKSLHSDYSAHSDASRKSHGSQASVRSQQSGKSREGFEQPPKLYHDVDEISRDSGVISKTQTLSDNKGKKGVITAGIVQANGSLHERSSDESTTASDILIRSTLDKSERSIHETNSSASKCSKSSYGVENFNSSGPQKIKISKKHLREIKPFDDGQNPRSSSDSDGKVPSSLLGKEPRSGSSKSSKSNSNSSSGSDSKGSATRLETKVTKHIEPGVGHASVNVNVAKNTNSTLSAPLGKLGAPPSFPKGVDNLLSKKQPVRKLAEKAMPVDLQQGKGNTKPPVIESVSQKTRTTELETSTHEFGNANVNAGHENGGTDNPLDQLRSTPKYFVERHTPEKKQQAVAEREVHALIPERKNLLQDLEDSVEITTVQGKDSSSSSSQPEIVTVPERIVTISAKISISPSSTISDLLPQTFTPPIVTFHGAGKQLGNGELREPVTGSKKQTTQSGTTSDEEGKQLASESRVPTVPGEAHYFDYNKGAERSFMGEYGLDESNTIPPALPRDHFEKEPEEKLYGQGQTLPSRFQGIHKTSSHGLRQGAMVDGLDAPDKQKCSNDVEIVQSRMSVKQKAREIFAKRQGGPVRRVVQPQIVGHKTKPTSQTEEYKEGQLGQSNDQVLTAAAAASAAVAATQPFLKAQYEMEAKMSEMLAKISELQSGGVKAPDNDSERVQVLEKQLANVTEKRIEYMEKLQEQQMAMQAKLLSMTRAAPVSRSHVGSRSPENVYRRPDTSTPTAGPSKRAFTKSVVSKPAVKGDHSDRVHKYSTVDVDESNSPLDTPAPRSRAPKPTSYDTSDIEFKARQRARSRSKSPGKKDIDTGILHQILASAGSPHREVTYNKPPPPSQPPLQIRRYDNGQSPNVKKAKDLVEDLSNIKDQVKNLVEETENWKPTKTEQSQTQTTINISAASQPGPSPLDQYLELPEKGPTSPYKSVPDLSHSQFNAPLPAGFKDAENILKQVQKNRGYLESNMASVLRARQEVEVFSLLEAVYHDSSNKEKARIQKLVDGSIAKLRREVEREVTDDMILAEMKKQKDTAVPGAVKIPAPAPVKPAPKYGLRGRLAEPKPEPKKPAVKRVGFAGKENLTRAKPVAKKAKSVFEDEDYMTQVYGKASYQKGRTTVKDPYLHFQNVPKHKAERPAGIVESKGKEKMSSKTQTTGGVKQFYFNPSTGTYIPIAATTSAPIPGHLIPMAVPLGGPRMDPGLTTPMSLTQAPDSVTFDPSKQTPQVTAAKNVAMVTIPTEEEEEKHSPELGKQVLPAVDIDTDLSEISEITEEPRRQVREVKEKTRVHIQSPDRSPNKTPSRSPGKTHYEVVYHEEPKEEKKVEELEEKKEENENSSCMSLTHSSLSQPKVDHVIHGPDEEQIEEELKEEQYSSGTTTRSSLTQNKISPLSNDVSFSDEDADVETATGLQFPGYQPVEPPVQDYHGPSFPPKQPSSDRQLTSDLIAEDIKRRDILQNKATEWLEQELMARIITEIYPIPEREEPADVSHIVSEGSEESIAEDKEQSIFVMDRIGRQGLQLFVDAGCAVDNDLVSQLTQQVLLEKIQSMLGQRPDQDIVPLSTGATTVLQQQGEDEIEEELPDQIQHRPALVRTPEPTPKASPTSSPPRRRSPAATPRASPPPGSPRPVQQVLEPPEPMILPAPVVEPESEPESSASLDIQEELKRLAAQLKPEGDTSVSLQTLHDVPTPPESPKPEPVVEEMYRPLTPPALSPRPVVEEDLINFARGRMKASKIAVPAAVSRPPPPSSPEPVEAPEPEEEEEIMEQPKPVVFTVAGTQTDVEAEKKVQVPSAEPKPRSKSPSESSYTESSSISETFNECVSEGQWLINKSDGEVADFPIDEDAVRQRMLRSSHKKVDVSSASTWKDIDDVDLEDMTDVSKSEGEFLYKTPLPPEKDPVLDLLARLQSSSPQYGIQQMSSRQVTNILDTSGKSVGEITQYGSGQSEGEVIQRSQPKKSVREVNAAFQSQHQRQKSRSVSPEKSAQSPTRVSFEERRRSPSPRQSPSPTRGILKQSNAGMNESGQYQYYEAEREIPVRDTSGRGQSPSGRLTPGGRVSQGRGPTMSAGARAPMKSAMRKPPQVIKSSALPESHGSGARPKMRKSSEEFRDSAEKPTASGYYSSDLGTRTMTPDQMNMDALIQSGYLSQSFSQSDNGRPSADPRRSYGAESSLRSSGDMRESRTSAGGRSLGYSYGTEGSMTESELQRLVGGTGVLKMSLTLPGTGEFEEASDLSEIDITDGGNTR